MARTQIPLGKLVNFIFEDYRKYYGDSDIAAVATEATLSEFFYQCPTWGVRWPPLQPATAASSERATPPAAGQDDNKRTE